MQFPNVTFALLSIAMSCYWSHYLWYSLSYIISNEYKCNCYLRYVAQSNGLTIGRGLLPWYNKTYFGQKQIQTQQENDKTTHYHIHYNNAASSESPF